MTVSFEPQFHRRIGRNQNVSAWIALPPPETLVPAKSAFYRQWQLEERMKLQAAGETVLPDEYADSQSAATRRPARKTS